MRCSTKSRCAVSLATLALAAAAAGAVPATPARRPAPESVVLDLEAIAPAGADRGALARDADARQYRHDFAGAEAVLTALLARWPGDANARLARAQARIARGNPRGALADCFTAAAGLDALAASACAAQARAALGEPAAARALVERALAMDGGRADPAVRSYAAGIAAELAAHAGQDGRAERWYRQALATAGNGHYPAVAYADFLLARGRPSDALAILTGQVTSPGIAERRERAARALAAFRAGEGT